MKKLFALILLLFVVRSEAAIKYYDDYPNNSNPPTNFIISIQTKDKTAGGIPYNYWTLDQMSDWLASNGLAGQGSNVTFLTITNNTFVTTNVTVNVPGGITNLNLTPLTVMFVDVNNAESSIPTGSGILTNNGAGDVGWSSDFQFTNVIPIITNNIFVTTNVTIEQPGGFTNMNLTPLTVMFADANSAESSIPNAPGVLTNNGSGGVGFSQSLSLQELDAQNFYPTNMFTGLTNYGLLGTDGDGKLTAGSATITNLTVTNLTVVNLYAQTNFSTNLYFVQGRGNTLIVTNLTVINGLTNQSLLASQFVATDANKAEISTLDGSSLTNLTIRYDTNSIPSSGALTFGHAYFTNLQASVVLPAFTLGSAAYYESLVICVTNSGATTTTLTMPSGVKVAVANGGGNLIYCTNGTRTMVFVDHYGTVLTNAWKNDF